jgi:hypothetical protein
MDPMHGRLSFPDIVRDIVDTELFQRLRRIQAAGPECRWCFPGCGSSPIPPQSSGTAALGAAPGPAAPCKGRPRR